MENAMNNQQTKLVALNMIVACLMTVGAVDIASAATLAKFRNNGSSVCATGNFGTDNAGFFTTCIYTNTETPNNIGGAPSSVFMDYIAYDNNGWSNGYGTIPASAVQFSPNQVTLSINPASVPGFSNQSTLAGNITLTWEKVDFWSNDFNGHSQSTYGAIRRSQSGISRLDSANSTGTVFGYAYTNASANIGKSRDMTITLEK
jgi:hypothetical protein